MAQIAEETPTRQPAGMAREATTAARARVWVPVSLALVTLVGLLVRLNGLTDYGIWFDEGYHIALVKLPTVSAMIEAVLSNPPSDPLYVLLLRGWVRLFGTGDGAVRMLSVLLSTATLPVTFWLGRAISGRVVGLLGALFFALAPYGVELGQEAALYTLAALTATAALAAGWRWRESGRGVWLYVAFGVAAIYSHYVVAAILALFALLAPHANWGQSRVRLRDWLLANAAVGLAWLPWLAALAVYWLNAPVPRATLPHPATWSDLYGALVQLSSGTPPLYLPGEALEGIGLLAGGLLLLLGLVAGPGGVRLLGLVAGLIFIVPAVVSAFTGLWLFVSHFMLFLLPTLMLIAAAGVLFLLARAQTWGRVAGAVLLLTWVGVQVTGLWAYYRYPPHGTDGLRELAGVLREKPADVVLVTPPALSATLEQYYPGEIRGLPSDFDLRAVYLPYDPEDWNATSVRRLEEIVRGRDRYWLVYRPELDAEGQFLAAVKSRYRQVEERSYTYATIYLFEAGGPGGP